MEKIDKAAYEKMRRWVWRNARPLELSLWRYLFEGGERADILLALSAYQNDDGGFGNALDCDCWNPESSPYNTLHALRLLRMVDITDPAHPMLQKMLHYLETTPYQNENGWLFAIPSNKTVPHAIWWEYEGERNALETPGITAPICGYALRYLPPDAPFYQKAKHLARALLALLDADIQFADTGVGGYRTLLEDIEAAHLVSDFAADAQWQRYKEKLGAEKEMFEDDDTPLLPEGVWEIPWRWYTGEKYADEWAISRNWWRSRCCIERLLYLKQTSQFPQ